MEKYHNIKRKLIGNKNIHSTTIYNEGGRKGTRGTSVLYFHPPNTYKRHKPKLT